MSAWRKVFLRNGLIWPPYVLALPFFMGEFSRSGWPLGFSEATNYVLTFVVLIPVSIAMVGGFACMFRRMVQWVASEAADKGKKMPKMRWRWLWSYFFEIDEEYRLRP